VYRGQYKRTRTHGHQTVTRAYRAQSHDTCRCVFTAEHGLCAYSSACSMPPLHLHDDLTRRREIATPTYTPTTYRQPVVPAAVPVPVVAVACSTGTGQSTVHEAHPSSRGLPRARRARRNSDTAARQHGSTALADMQTVEAVSFLLRLLLTPLPCCSCQQARTGSNCSQSGWC